MDDIRRVKPTPNKPNPESPNLPDPVEPTSLTPPEPHHKKSRKKLVIIILIILLAVGAAAAYFFYFKDTKEQSETSKSSASDATKPEDYTERFYVTKRPDTVVVYNPVAKTATTTKIDLSGERSLASSDIYTNRPLILNSDGTKMLYASVTYKADGLAELDSTVLSLFESQKETKLVSYKVDDGQSLVDWAINPAGDRVYYVVSGQKQGENPAKVDLYTMLLSDKKAKLLKADILFGADKLNPMYIDKDGVVRIYSGLNGQLTEHKVFGDTYDKRVIGTLSCGVSCSLEYPFALSPDAKQLLLEAGGGTTDGNFIYSVMELATGKVSEIAKTSPTTEQWTSSYWSPDGGRIAHDVATFGDPPSNFKTRVDIFNMNNKTSSVLFDETKENIGQISGILGWSSDSRFLAFSAGGKIKFYDFSTNTVSVSDIPNDEVSSSDTAFGWY